MNKIASPLGFNFDPEKLSDFERIRFIQDQPRALFLAKRQQPDLVFNAAALEGNPISLPEVKTLLDGITVGGHQLSDQQQVLHLNESYLRLYEMVQQKTFILEKDIFCELHGIIAEDEALTWGVFRDGNVTVGGTQYRPPSSDKLPDLFEAGLEQIKKIDPLLLRALAFFLFGSLHQFFYDGNKRTSRLMMNGELLRNGLPVLNVFAKDQLEFNRQMIHFYDTQDATEALNFFTDYYYQQNSDLGFDG